MPVAAALPSLGDPPAAPSPEEVARWPRGGISKHGPAGPFTVNTAGREEVRNFFNAVYSASEGFSIGWTGDASTCLAGATDAAFRDLVALRVNFFRALAGVPAGIVFDSAFNTMDQKAALMMGVARSLSHTPGTSWPCYTSDGAEAAGNSNLALGSAGPDAITSYIEDFGGGNGAVGHRRWLLYPQTKTMGTGDVPETLESSSANSTWVFDSNFDGTRPATRDSFVGWPPPGFVPYQVVFARWSFSYPGANLNNATVTMTSNGVAVGVTKEPVQGSIGENTLVWYPAGLDTTMPYAWPRPTIDTVYAINVQNVVILGNPRNFSYTVTVFDPKVPGPDTVLPTISGPDQPAVNQGNAYTFRPVPGASGYQWRQTRRVPFSAVEGAESGLTYFTTNTSPGYSVIVTSPRASGRFAFHLAHADPATTQILSYTRVMVPGTNAQMQFKSRLGLATRDQVAQVQFSVDGGNSWQEVYAQAGTDGFGETVFSTRTLPLGSYAGRSILVRFVYLSTGGYFSGADAGVGWYIDDISFSNTEELTNPLISNSAGLTNFVFNPPQAGDYGLDVRAQLYNQFYLEWGSVKRVTATASAMSMQFVGRPSISGSQFQIDFNVDNYRAGSVFQLWKATGPAGAWNPDTGASFQTLIPNTKFRATTSTGGASKMFYRLQAN